MSATNVHVLNTIFYQLKVDITKASFLFSSFFLQVFFDFFQQLFYLIMFPMFVSFFSPSPDCINKCVHTGDTNFCFSAQ